MSDGRIVVLAGVNGAGKSSILGELLVSAGTPFYNPDEQAKLLRLANPDLPPDDANSQAWHAMVTLLRHAIENRISFFFETTLGASTIPGLLHLAAERGLPVDIAFIGLDSPERHIARVAARVKKGGHDIPASKIRERYASSVRNLTSLVPKLRNLRVFDNSTDSIPALPIVLLEVREGTLRYVKRDMPNWAKPIAVAAMSMRKALITPGPPGATM